jgi:hypothetical protein
MSKQIKLNVEFNSLRDAAYNQAVASDATRDITKYVMECVPNFPESLPDEMKAELVDGYRLRFNENNPPIEYALISGNYLPVASLTEIPAKSERVKIGVAVAFSYTQQQFGRLKEDNPNLHSVIKEWRDRANAYTNNKLKDLKAKAKAILNEGKPRERSAVLDFNERVIKMLETLGDNCKTAQSRGDESANLEKYRQAKIAFLAKWNHS